jgi:chromosome segregation ATPase
MTATNDRLDRIERIVEQLGEMNAQSKRQHDQDMVELRQLQASNARAIEANSAGIAENRAGIAENRVAIAALTSRVAEVTNGVDACIRTIDSMNRVMESLEVSRNEMQEQQRLAQQRHDDQMERLGRMLEVLITRYPTGPEQ